jgi:hypothetical protein
MLDLGDAFINARRSNPGGFFHYTCCDVSTQKLSDATSRENAIRVL